MSGRVEAINVSPSRGVLPHAVDSIGVTPEGGLEGDRYDGDITLVEAEALEALAADTGIDLGAAEVRRQVLTRGIRLNDLVGRRFKVGEVVCEGVERCEPCNHLQKLTKPGVLRGLAHRGGLRAGIVKGGGIAVGDEVAGLG